MLRKLSIREVPKRYVIVLMIFIGYANMTYLHTNLGMAVVEMTTQKNVSVQAGYTDLVSESISY